MSALFHGDVLDRAADLIEPEGSWTQGVSSRDDNGAEVVDNNPRSPRAVCWCIGGALYYVTERDVPGSDAQRLLDRMLGEDFIQWNDAPERTQAEVVAKLREAAVLARSQQSSVAKGGE